MLVITAISGHIATLPPFTAAAIALLAITAISYLSYYFYEKPMNKLIKRFFKE